MSKLLRFNRLIKNKISELLVRNGYQISKVRKYDDVLEPNAFDAQVKLLCGIDANHQIIFDVGANRGQTYHQYRSRFPKARIHCFEPVKDFYEECLGKVVNDNLVVVNNQALGSTLGRLTLNETVGGQSSSLLLKTETIKLYFSEKDFTVARSYSVEVSTLDYYCQVNDIERINILKIDTEGFELNVLRGASGLLKDSKIDIVFTEINFDKFWTDCALYHHIASYLEAYDMQLFGLYGLGRGSLGATRSGDAVFVRKDIKLRLMGK